MSDKHIRSTGVSAKTKDKATVNAEPNYRAAVDARRPIPFAFGRHRPGTTQHGRWASL